MERAGDINRNKERLAHELTALVHGRAEADKALGSRPRSLRRRRDSDNMPSTTLPADAFGRRDPGSSCWCAPASRPPGARPAA